MKKHWLFIKKGLRVFDSVDIRGINQERLLVNEVVKEKNYQERFSQKKIRGAPMSEVELNILQSYYYHSFPC